MLWLPRQSIKTAMTKPHSEWPNQQKFISPQFWRLEDQDQSNSRVSSFWGPWEMMMLQTFLSLPTDCHPQPESSNLPSRHVCVNISSSYKDTTDLEWGPSKWPILTNDLYKDPISKYSFILQYWGLELQHMNFGVRPQSNLWHRGESNHIRDFVPMKSNVHIIHKISAGI